MSATEIFNNLNQLTKTEFLSDDTKDITIMVSDFLSLVESANLSWYKPFPQWKTFTYQSILEDIIIHITLDFNNANNIMVLSKNNEYVTLLANHTQCLRCIKSID